LGPDDWGEWQAAVYLLSGNDVVWAHFGAAVMARRSIGVVAEASEGGQGPSASSEREVMRWAAHFWDVDRCPARFPYVFETFLFRRRATALHLRKTVAAATLGFRPS
jgi:hypothetical protein